MISLNRSQWDIYIIIYIYIYHDYNVNGIYIYIYMMFNGNTPGMEFMGSANRTFQGGVEHP